MSEIELWFDARCSKCRAARDRLLQAGAPHRLYRFRDAPPSRARLLEILGLLGTDDPLAIARVDDRGFVEAGVAAGDADRILDALAAHPEWIQRPIAVHGRRAIVARPPERIGELLGEAGDALMEG